MPRATINGTTAITFTPGQLLTAAALLLAIAGWAWRQDARTSAQEEAHKSLSSLCSQMDKDVKEIRNELVQLRKGCALTPTPTPVTETR